MAQSKATPHISLLENQVRRSVNCGGEARAEAGLQFRMGSTSKFRIAKWSLDVWRAREIRARSNEKKTCKTYALSGVKIHINFF